MESGLSNSVSKVDGNSDASKTLAVRGRASGRKVFDWISNPTLPSITPFQRFILDIDWNRSPLGPMQYWPTQLRQMVLLVIQDPSPAVVYWGDEATIVYNEAYTQLIGQKHPSLQGHDPKIGFAEVWDHFEKLLARQRETAETTVEANAYLLFHRHGFLEETYFTWKFVPIIGDDGWIVGSHATVVEVTREVISDRRLSIVRTLSKELSQSRNIKDLWTRILRGLENADKDIPLALLYTVADSSEAARARGESRSTPLGASNSEICLLEGTVGIPEGHALSPSTIDLGNDTDYLSTALKAAVTEMNLVIFQLDDDTKSMFAKLNWRGFGVASTTFVACPIIPINSGKVLAFLVIALNPRRPFDEDYQAFVHLLTQQVTTPQLSAVILREEIDKRQEDAKKDAIDKDRLSRELSESESKFAKFATRAPVGLAIFTPEGLALSANDLWRDLTQLEIGSHQVSWGTVLAEGELETVLAAWDRVGAEKKAITTQTRIKRLWQAPDLDPDGMPQTTLTHILLAMYPDLNANNEVSSIMSCVTDISSLKWTESQLRRKMDQAIEMKKQQEKFIDMTSHEMRNPLSALIGCADEIITSLNEHRRAITASDLTTISHLVRPKERARSLHHVDEAIEAAETIIYCAMHQKRIIDDILMLSRLDANLLLVSPEPTQPITLVKSALKMFELELKRANTRWDFVEQESLRTLDVQWTLLDPSRVLQVIINLMTNAIKFTRTEKNRYIKVSMGASLQRPCDLEDKPVKYVRRSDTSPDQTSGTEWRDGEVIYISIDISDTGRGLSESEINNLFHLFAQANPKTYQTYGGSGLGLFISRRLVEMQGGQIGVRSQLGQGSTFQFYVKTRRTSPRDASGDLRSEFQLMAREDAIREACGVEFPEFPSLGQVTDLELVQVASPSSAPIFHILVVEDNLVNQKVVVKQLRKLGHVAIVANHGKEAIEFIEKSEYWSEVENGARLSVVLMDLEMPVMDGLTCVRKIRELQGEGKIIKHLPVIAVTANARRDQVLASKEAGMDDVITKPYRMQDMLHQIKQLVTKYNTFGNIVN